MKPIYWAVLSIVLTLVTPSTAATPTNLAGYWPLDDEPGSVVVIDESLTSNGTPYNGTSLGTLGVRSGSLAAEFDGNGDYISIPHHNNFLLNSGTIVFWFRADTTSKRSGLLSKDSKNLDTGGHISIFQESDNRVSVRIQSTTTSYTLYSTSTIQQNQWHHIAVVFGTGGFELYMDGVLQSSDNYEGGLGTNSGGTGNFEPLVVGSNAWASNDLSATPIQDHFDGAIDDIGFISERWDAETIATLVTTTGPGTNKDLADFAIPAVFYVRTRGDDTNDGLTPQTSFRSIQHAINRCTRPGTTIYVGSGAYQESLEIGINAGINTVSGTQSNPIRIIGDTTGQYTFDEPGRIILDGRSIDTRGITITSRDFWTFQGLTLRNQLTYGILGTSNGMSVINCTIEVPRTFAIYSTATGDITITNSVFERSATSGHAIWVTPRNQTTPTSVTITRNDFTMKGDLYQSTGFERGWQAIRERSDVQNGVPRYTYGIIVFGWRSSMVDRIEISNNQLSDFYLSIFAGTNSATMTNSIIANNTITGSFYTVFTWSFRSGQITMINNLLDTCYFGLFSYSWQAHDPIVTTNLENNITADMARYHRPFELDILTGSPRFTDAQAGQFSLELGSPAIDAGTETNAPATDLANRSRPSDGDNDGIAQIDIGAYELVTKPTRIKIVQWREISGHRIMEPRRGGGNHNGDR